MASGIGYTPLPTCNNHPRSTSSSVVGSAQALGVAVLLGLSLVLCIWWRTAADSGQFPAQRWQELAPIPDALGVAGPFVGASGGALLLAGGANFPDRPPWEGGAKHWLDAVYALESPQATRWMLVGRLPHPLGYGVSASWRGRLLCVGGSDGSAHRATVLALRYSYRVGTGTVEMEAGPSLPVALANAAGVLVGDVLYVAGGSASPQATEACSQLWRLHLVEGLSASSWRALPCMHASAHDGARTPLPTGASSWRELPAIPGPGRVLPAIGWSSLTQRVLLISGARLLPTADGTGTTRDEP